MNNTDTPIQRVRIALSEVKAAAAVHEVAYFGPTDENYNAHEKMIECETASRNLSDAMVRLSGRWKDIDRIFNT